MSQPFARAIALMSLIAAELKRGVLPAAVFANAPAYSSRGHGEGLKGNKHSRHTVAQDKRAALKARNKARNK